MDSSGSDKVKRRGFCEKGTEPAPRCSTRAVISFFTATLRHRENQTTVKSNYIAKAGLRRITALQFINEHLSLTRTCRYSLYHKGTRIQGAERNDEVKCTTKKGEEI